MSNFSVRDHTIDQINQHFYTSVAESFATTRETPWEGFLPILAYINEGNSLLDLACGNGRLYHFLEKYIKVNYNGSDTSAELLEKARASGVPNLIHKNWELSLAQNNQYDVVTCFGFLHHLSSVEQLTSLFDQAYHHADIVIISRWNCIMNTSLMARQLDLTSFAGQNFLKHYNLDAEEFTTFEFLLDWQRSVEAIRYVRYWTDQELQVIWNKLGLKIVDTWLADGKSNAENSYFVLQKIPYIETKVVTEKTDK